MRASSAAPRTLSGPKKWREKRTISVAAHNNGCQPTSKAFAEYEKALGLEHIFTSYCNPKGDADTERVIRTIKEDLLWINEFKTLDELKEALGKWQHDYNHVFPHSSLENCTPVEYEERWYKGTEPQNTRAKKILRKESLFLADESK